MTDTRSRVPAVHRASAVLSLIAEQGVPLSLADIASGTGIPKTSVMGICHALTADLMLTRGEDGSYWLGPRLAELAAGARKTSTGALRFGVMFPTVQNPYFAAMIAGAQAEIDAVGGEIHTRSAEEDLDTQIRQMTELLEAGVDVLLIDAVSQGGFDEPLALAEKRGVPVVAIGSRVDGVSLSMTSDNVQAGLLAGLHLVTTLRHGATVAIIDGLAKNANADRVEGFREALRDRSDIRIVDHVRGRHDSIDSGYASANALFDRHPDLDGVFTVCDPIGFGVAASIRERALPTVVVSVDGRAEAVEQITHDGPIVATAAQDPVRTTQVGTKMAIDLYKGNRATEGALTIPVRLITAANAEDYTPWG